MTGGIGSVIADDGVGQSLPAMDKQGVSIMYIDPSIYAKMGHGGAGGDELYQKAYQAARDHTYRKIQDVIKMSKEATDADNPEVDGKSVISSSQADKDTVAIDSSGRGYKFSEDLIPNMPKDRDFKDDITTMKFLTPDKLEKAEVLSVVKWQEEVSTKVEDYAIYKVRVLMMFIGIVFCLVGGLMMLLYVFDRWSWLPVSAMSTVTFGRIRVAMDVKEYGEGYHVIDTGKHKVKIVNFTWILIWSSIFTFIGVFVMSGGLYQFLSWLVTAFKWFKF